MTTERRCQSRTSLRVPLFLLPCGWLRPIQTETENVSMDGFFCRTREAFAPGDQVKFLLMLPTAPKESEPPRATCLQGIAEVVRVGTDAAAGYAFSIGCRLSGYRVLTNPELTAVELSTLLSEDGQFDAWLKVNEFLRLRPTPA